MIASAILWIILAQAVSQADSIADFVVQSIWTTCWSCIVAVIYLELRVAKEGASADQIAAVFD